MKIGESIKDLKPEDVVVIINNKRVKVTRLEYKEELDSYIFEYKE